MRYNKKIEAFTLSEMIVVLILTAIVVGLAFSVLTLVQKHINSIQNNFNNTTQLNKLEQSLNLDFNRFSKIEFNELDDVLFFSNEVETKAYRFKDSFIVKDIDTFYISINKKALYFEGSLKQRGTLDAIKIETSKAFQNKNLFVFKKNDATQFID
jgi:type II secretory pathway component PulJ